MAISVISAWYNEEIIAPYFLAHYEDWVDNIVIILDSDTKDSTPDILKKHPKVKIVNYTYPNGFDDKIKVSQLLNQYKLAKSGYAIVVDSDEFVLPYPFSNFNVFRVKFLHPYRHKTDKDLDPNNKPIIYQRRHGVEYNVYDPDKNHYIKPCVAKIGLDVFWEPGQHAVYQKNGTAVDLICPELLTGMHWQCADPSIVLYRHTKNRLNRNGPDNIAAGFGTHFHLFTEQNVINDCTNHLNDEIIL